MKNLLDKIFFKAIMLILITAVPIIVYIFIQDDAQLTWNINGIRDMNKYKMSVEFSPEKEQLVTTAKIEFVNKSKESLDKVFLYINNGLNTNKEVCSDLIEELDYNGRWMTSQDINIESVKIEGKKVDYKIIGKNNDVLMINLNELIKKSINPVIEIKYTKDISYLASSTNKGTIKYEVKDWYPIIVIYDNGWKIDYTSDENNVLYSDLNYFLVEINVPEGFEVETSARIVEKLKKKNTHYFTYQEQGATKFDFSLLAK